MRSSPVTLPRVPAQQKPPPEDHLKRLHALARRRTSVMDELRDAVVAAVAAGGSVRTVATAADVSTATVRDWVAKARKH
jgi:transposase-like protein